MKPFLLHQKFPNTNKTKKFLREFGFEHDRSLPFLIKLFPNRRISFYVMASLTDETVPSYEPNTLYVVIDRGQAGGQVFVKPPLAWPGLLTMFLMDLFNRIVNL